MLSQRFAAILLLLAATATLINSSLFPYASSAAVFLFETATAVFFIYCIGGWRKSGWPLISRRTIPAYIFLLYILYFVVQGLFCNEGLQARHYLLLGYLMFFTACLQGYNQRVIDLLLSGVVLLAALECIICLLQWWGVVQSKNSFFKVTGSWVNPNVTAMFLAMSCPAACYLLLQQRRSSIWVLGLLGCILASLLLLKCRTALIGAGLAVFIICNYRFRWLFHLRKRSPFKKFVTAAVTLLLLTPVCYYAYKAKQHSADGRLLIWKVSTGIIAQHPFNGVGLGMFEHDYNLAQADYIKNGKAGEAEKNNATHVYMAYNEWLETGVEGGIPAMLLLTALFASLILLYPKGHSSPDMKQKGATANSQEERYAKVTAWAAMVAFITMSMVNFSFQALPAMCLFLLFLAILCSPGLPVKSSSPVVRGLFVKSLARRVTVAVLVLSALYFMYSRISTAKDLLQVKKASVTAASGDNAGALEILVPLTAQLDNAESYLQVYGNVLMNTKNYSDAIIQFNRAKHFVSYPNLYLKLGECYTSLQQYENARSCFLLAHNMEPSRLAPEYALMQLSVSMKDSSTALAKAKWLINASPKTATARSRFYQQQALEIIRRLQ